MKKTSVLIRRAMLYTAVVTIAAIAVGLFAALPLQRADAKRTAREALQVQAQSLCESAAQPDGERFLGKLALFTQGGGCVWLADESGARCLTGGETELPASAAALTAGALDGKEQYEFTDVEGQASAVALFPVSDEGKPVGAALIASLPLKSAGSTAFLSLSGAAAALIAAVLAGFLCRKKMLEPAVLPLTSLRDVTVSVSEGNFNARADETVPGEVGELAKALNNVSTQLSRSMYTLILERNRLRQMLDGLSEGIVAVDREGTVTHTNPALDSMFAKPKSMLHLPDPRMKIIPDETVWEDFDSVMRTREPLNRNLNVRDMTLRLAISPIIDELGEMAGAVGLFSDITQMERLERTRREYVSNVSHELRTPLTAMRALVEPLKEGMVTSEKDRMRYYDIILREVMRLSRLINDQLELSRLQSGTLAIQKSKVALDDLVYDVCDRYVSIAKEHGLELNVLTDFSDCPVVYANADRVEQMLIILLDNAIKYTEEGSVNVSGSWDDEKVILSIRDTGVGIEDEDLPYVFDRFYKVDKAHSGKGSGLGLSIAKELLKRMGEEIWVSSEKGKGTEFCFTVHRPEKKA